MQINHHEKFTLLLCLLISSFKLFSQAGHPDSSFGNNGLSISGPNQKNDNSFLDVGLQSNGKIIAVGSLNTYNTAVARFTTDGAPDAGFGTAGYAKYIHIYAPDNYSYGAAVAIPPDDKIIVGVSFISIKFALLRYKYLVE